MKTRTRTRTGRLAVAMAAGVCWAAVAQPLPNLVKNGDFANGSADWTKGAKPECIQIGEAAPGNACLLLTGPGLNVGTHISQRLPVGSLVQGQSYRLKFRAKVEGKPAKACAMVANPNWDGSKTKFLEGNTDWAEYEMTFEPPPDQNQGRFEVIVRLKGEGKIWVDDIAVEKLEGKTGGEVKPIEAKLASSAETAGENLVQNSGFEEEFSQWSRENWSKTEGVEYAIDSQSPHGGGKCLRIRSSLPGRHASVQRIKDVPENASFEVSLWVKGEDYGYTADGTPAMVACDFMPVKAVPRPHVNITPRGTFGWKELRFTVKSPPGTKELYLNLIHTRGTLWFDDVAVRPVTNAAGGQVNADSGEKIMVKKHYTSDGKTLESVEVTAPRFSAVVHRIGGKVSRWDTDEAQWCAPGAVESWSQGIGKDWLKEDELKELLTTPYELTVDEKPEETVVRATRKIEGEPAGLAVSRAFTFRPDASYMEAAHEILNEGKARTITPRIHHYLNIWRTAGEEPLFRLYVAGTVTNPPIEAAMTPDLTDTFKVPGVERGWMGVLDLKQRGLCFQAQGGAPAEWMCWSGFEKERGTIEMLFDPVSLKQGEQWTCKYVLYSVRGLPSLGVVTTNLITSVGAPDIVLFAPRAMGDALVDVTTDDGGKYRLSARLGCGENLKVDISSIIHAGRARVAVDSERLGKIVLADVPRLAEKYPKKGAEAYGEGPCRYLPLTTKPTPDPGLGGFIYYFSDYYQGEGYISPDAATMLAFGQNSRLEGKSPDIRLVIDTPPGVEFLGGRFITGIEKSEVQTDQGKGLRHRIKVSYGYEVSRGGATELITRTTLPAGSTQDFWYATEIDGALTHRTRLPVHVIDIPAVKAPRQIITRFWPLHGVLDAFPDMSGFRRIGFQHPDQAYFERVIKPNARNKLMEEAGRMGLKNESVDFMRFITGQDQDGFNEEINGKRVGGQACPTYRGPDFAKILDFGKRAIDAGFYMHTFDPERGDGARVCFCPRCATQFKDYLGKANPALAYQDPHEFMKNPAGNVDLRRAWILFKAQAYADAHRAYRDAMTEHMRQKELDPTTFQMILAAQPGWAVKDTRPGKDNWLFSAVETSLQDPRLLSKAFDVYAPMIYIEINGRFRMKADMLEIPSEIAGILSFSDGAVSVAPTLSVGYPYTHFLCNIEPNGMMKYQVLEAFGAGAKGVGLHSECWFDALDMQGFAEAMRQVVPVEDVLMAGRPIEPPRLKDEKGQVYVKGIESAESAVILVSEYSIRNREATIVFQTPLKGAVVNLSTGEKVGESTGGVCRFPVSLSGDRAIMFFVGDAGRLKRP